MAVDFNLPTVDTTYTAFPTQIIENIDAALQMLSVGSPSNVPNGAIKWDDTLNRLRKYNGSAYVDLTSTYDFNAALNVNQLNLGDDEAVRLGASQDFQLFHRASDSLSIISESGGGYLSLQSNGSKIEMYDSANNRAMAEFNTGGSCSLKHGATTRLETSSSGATITGTLTTTVEVLSGASVKIDGSAGGNRNITVGEGRTADGNSFINLIGDDTHTTYGGRLIRNGGANSKTELLHRGTQSLDINAVDAGSVTLRTTNLARLHILSGGDVGIGLTNPSNKLHVYSGSTNAFAVQATVDGANMLLIDNDTECKIRTIDGRLHLHADSLNNVANSEIRLLIDGSNKWTLEADGDVSQTGNLTLTHSSGEGICQVIGHESSDATVQLVADQGDNNGDRWKLISVASDNTFRLQNNENGSNVTKWRIETDGDVIQTGNLTISNTQPFIQFDDTDNESDFQIGNAGGRFRIRDTDNAADRISVTTQGRVGINNTNPQAALHINGSGGLGSIRLIDSNTSNNAPNFEIIGKRSDSNNNTAFAANIFLAGNRTDAKVHGNKILGNVNFGGNHTNGNESNISYTACIRAQASGDFDSKSDMPTDLVFCTGTAGKDRDGESAGQSNAGTERMRIHASGNVTVSGAQIKVVNGSAATPSYSFTNSNNMGFYRHSSNQIGVSIGGTGMTRFKNNQFGPQFTNVIDLGQGSLRFQDIFLMTNPNVSSDQNVKNTIATSDLGLDFINKLNPVSFKYNEGTRTHYGLIAQEIETVLGAISKSTTDFAGFCKDEVDEDGNAMTPIYGLRYSEFISPIIKAIQELSAKVAALEAA